MDNWEHLLNGAAVVAEVLASCEGLKILATSREPLRLVWERTQPVPVLAVPDEDGANDLAGLARVASVALFLDRSHAATGRFVLTEANAADVCEICRRLDGLPLAIELAASWVKTLSIAEIAGRLDQRLRLLIGGDRAGPPRHQSLRAALDWGYDLLSGPEKHVFIRLSVFAGGWTLEAAEVVCSADGMEPDDVLQLLARLVDRSLVMRDDQETRVRYRLLETLRQYAQEQLEASRAQAAARMRHATFFQQLAERLAPDLWGPREPEWRAQLELEHDNLRTALRWLIGQGDVEGARRLAAALWRFLQTGHHISEGRAWLSEVLALSRSARPSVAHAQVLLGAGNLASLQGDHPATKWALEEGLAVSRKLGDPATLALALFQVGQAAWWRGDYAAAHTLAEEGVRTSQAAAASVLEVLNGYVLTNVLLETGEPVAALALGTRCHTLALESGYTRGIAMALTTLGRANFEQGKVAAARVLLEQGLTNFRATEFSYAVAWALTLLGWVATDEQDFPRSQALLAESLALRRELAAQAHVAETLEGFARLAAAQRQPERALRLAGAGDGLRQREGTPLLLAHPAQLERWLAPARAALGPIAAAAAWDAGHELSVEQATTSALAEAISDSERAKRGSRPARSAHDTSRFPERKILGWPGYRR